MPKKTGLGEEFWLVLCGRPVPAKNTADGVRAVIKEKPIEPSPVTTYLQSKFGGRLDEALDAMRVLAKSYKPDDLEEKAFGLYEAFRPTIPPGVKGWGAKGELDLAKVRSLSKSSG